MKLFMPTWNSGHFGSPLWDSVTPGSRCPQAASPLSLLYKVKGVPDGCLTELDRDVFLLSALRRGYQTITHWSFFTFPGL